MSLIVFVVLGAVAFCVAVLPSPIRLALYTNSQSAAPATPFPEPAPALSGNDIAQITERPLFNAGRKKDPASPLVSALPELEAYRLTGLIVTSDTAVAVVERRDTKATVTLHIGDTFDGHVVKQISAEGVVFTGSGDFDVLRMPKAGGAKIVAQTATASGTSVGGTGKMGGRDKQ